jgi:hypothetical protein
LEGEKRRTRRKYVDGNNPKFFKLKKLIFVKKYVFNKISNKL